MVSYKTITKDGYIFDKRFFWSIFLILIIMFVMIGNSMKWDFRYRLHFTCYNPTCENPMFMGKAENMITQRPLDVICDEPWCTETILTKGVYGRAEPRYMWWFTMLAILLPLVGLLLNHIAYNKGKQFKVEVQIPKKIKDWIGELGDEE